MELCLSEFSLHSPNVLAPDDYRDGEDDCRILVVGGGIKAEIEIGANALFPIDFQECRVMASATRPRRGELARHEDGRIRGQRSGCKSVVQVHLAIGHDPALLFPPCVAALGQENQSILPETAAGAERLSRFGAMDQSSIWPWPASRRPMR